MCPKLKARSFDSFLRGRGGLITSELSTIEILSTVARRKREGMLDTDQGPAKFTMQFLEDAASGSFDRLELSPAVHREAARLLFGIDLSLRSLADLTRLDVVVHAEKISRIEFLL